MNSSSQKRSARIWKPFVHTYKYAIKAIYIVGNKMLTPTHIYRYGQHKIYCQFYLNCLYSENLYLIYNNILIPIVTPTSTWTTSQSERSALLWYNYDITLAMGFSSA